MARLPYVDPEDLPAEKRPLLGSLAEKDEELDERKHALPSGPLNVHRTLANNLELHERFREYGTTVWQSSGLSLEQREFVILATAHRIGSEYEWQQHVRIALDEGMTTDQIKAVSSNNLDQLAPEHAAIVEYARHFVDASVDDEVHETLARYNDDETILGIGMLTGMYIGLERLIDALDVELEVDFVGWDLENL